MGGQAGNGFAGGMGTSGPMGGGMQRPGGNAQSTMRRQQFMQGGGRVPGNEPQWGPMGMAQQPMGVNPMGAPDVMSGGKPPQQMSDHDQSVTLDSHYRLNPNPTHYDLDFNPIGGPTGQRTPDFSGLVNAMGQRPPGMGQPMSPQPGGGLQAAPMSPQQQALALLGGARRPQQTSPMGMQPRGQPFGPRPQQPRPPMPMPPGQYDADRLP